MKNLILIALTLAWLSVGYGQEIIGITEEARPLTFSRNGLQVVSNNDLNLRKILNNRIDILPISKIGLNNLF